MDTLLVVEYRFDRLRPRNMCRSGLFEPYRSINVALPVTKAVIDESDLDARCF
jgi:hypothetical protein